MGSKSNERAFSWVVGNTFAGRAEGPGLDAHDLVTKIWTRILIANGFLFLWVLSGVLESIQAIQHKIKKYCLSSRPSDEHATGMLLGMPRHMTLHKYIM